MNALHDGKLWWASMRLLAGAQNGLTREQLASRLAVLQAFHAQRAGAPVSYRSGIRINQSGHVMSVFFDNISLHRHPQRATLWGTWISEREGVLEPSAVGVAAMASTNITDPLCPTGYASEVLAELVDELLVAEQHGILESEKLARQFKQALALPADLVPRRYSWDDIVALSRHDADWKAMMLEGLGVERSLQALSAPCP